MQAYLQARSAIKLVTVIGAARREGSLYIHTEKIFGTQQTWDISGIA